MPDILDRRSSDINAMLIAEKLSHLDKTITGLSDAIKGFAGKEIEYAKALGIHEERQKVANNRINDLEDNQKKIVWTVITAFIMAVAGLVFK